MLASESGTSCHRILTLNVLECLIEALRLPLLIITAARVLWNLSEYAREDSYYQLKAITAAAPTVLKAILSADDKLQEVMVGLAAQLFKFLTSDKWRVVFQRAKIRKSELSITLVSILRKHRCPTIKVPRISRFAMELAIWMMWDRETNVHNFNLKLEGVLETTSEVENFNIFSGAVGMSRHSTTIYSLVETALKLLTVK